MQHSDQSAVDVSDEPAPVEELSAEPSARSRRRRLPDGAKAGLYVLFGIFLAAFIIGIWPLLEILQAPPLPK